MDQANVQDLNARRRSFAAMPTFHMIDSTGALNRRRRGIHRTSSVGRLWWCHQRPASSGSRTTSATTCSVARDPPTRRLSTWAAFGRLHVIDHESGGALLAHLKQGSRASRWRPRDRDSGSRRSALRRLLRHSPCYQLMDSCDFSDAEGCPRASAVRAAEQPGRWPGGQGVCRSWRDRSGEAVLQALTRLHCQ
jgi:hypothetical protein